jgi:ribonuclease HI
MVSGVIYAVESAGWRAEGPFRWVSEEGVPYELPEASLREGEAIDVEDALGALAASLARKVWCKAAAYWCGRGLERGCWWTQARSHLSGLERKGFPAAELEAMRVSMVGGAWTRSRIQQLGLDIDTVVCQRCDLGAEETDLHRCWQCPGNEALAACARSAHLCEEAERGSVEHPCFWLRGLIPSSWVEVPEPEDDELVVPVDALGALEGLSDVVLAFGDASGGAASAVPVLRRVGWGLAWIPFGAEAAAAALADPDGAFAGAGVASGNLAGPRQTVNRGELRAFLVLLESSRGAARVHFVTDSGYVQRGFWRAVRRGAATRGNRQRLRARSNVDLWTRVDHELAVAGRVVEVSKVASHRARHTAALGGAEALLHFVGNELADVLAGGAAMRSQLSGDAIRTHLELEARAAMVQRRLGAVLVDVAERDRRAPIDVPRERRVRAPWAVRRRRAVDASEHAATLGATAARCSACGETCRFSPRAAFLDWLGSPCCGPLLDRPAWPGDVRVRAPITLGQHCSHVSHELYYRAACECWYCRRCGAVATQQLRALRLPCIGEPGTSGSLNLQALSKGRAPGYSAAAKAFNKAKPSARAAMGTAAYPRRRR